MRNIKAYAIHAQTTLTVISILSFAWHAISIFAFVLYLGSPVNDPGDILRFWRFAMQASPILFGISCGLAIYAIVWFIRLEEGQTKTS